MKAKFYLPTNNIKANFSMPSNNISAKFGMNVTPDIRIFATKAELQIETDNRISGDNQLGNRINLTEEDILNLSVTVNNNYAVLDNKFTSIYETITNYGDIVSYNATDFATATQGALAERALQPNDNITLLNNNAGFITNAVNDLTNYYLKSETYTKTEVQQLIASIPKFTVLVVQELPLTGQPMTLYLVPKDGEAPDVYEEYVWVTDTNRFELIGSTAVDLTGYAKESWVLSQGYITSSALNGYATETFVNNGLATKQNALTAGDNIIINGNTISATDTTYTAGTGISIENGVISNTQTSAEWGNIEGDITDQTDLIEILDGKQDLLTSENAGTGIEIVNGVDGDETVSGNNSITLEKAAANGLNSVTVSGGLKRSLLPDGYTQYDYITVNGDCYYVTDYYPNTNTEVKTKTFVHKQPTSPLVTRWTAGPTNDTFGFYMGNVSGRLTIFYGRYSDGRYLNIENTKLNIEHSIYMGVNSITFDGTSYPITRDTFTSTQPIYIGAFNQTGSSLADMMYGRIYPVEFIENGRTVRQYIPCKNPSGVIGLYEVITGTFKTNAGTGTFTAGSGVALPSPTNPIPIVSNNGQLKYSSNLFNQSLFNTDVGITVTYYTFNIDNGTYTMSTNIPYASGSLANVFLFAGQVTSGASSGTNGVTINTPRTITVTNGKYTVAYRSRVSASDTAYNPKNYNWMLARSSSAQSYQPYIEGGLYVDGLTETITDSANNTATAEMLLSMGEYTDTQEILSGAVARKVGVIVLDGTEDWSTDTYGGYRRFYFTNSIGQYEELTPLICSHYLGKAENRQTPNSIFLPTTGRLTIYVDSSQSIDTVANWNSWLASQYANGTPVIVVYPLATPTTETVTGQALTTVQGDNTLTISQASVENLPISANYDMQGGTVINCTGEFEQQIQIGNTTLNESQLQALLALL